MMAQLPESGWQKLEAALQAAYLFVPTCVVHSTTGAAVITERPRFPVANPGLQNLGIESAPDPAEKYF